jgi:DNA modification methylase
MNETQMIEHATQPDLTGMQCYMQPYFRQKEVEIWNENNLDTMSRLKDNSIDLTVTSPPYDGLRTYNGYSFPFEEIAKELYRVTKQGGIVVWVVGDQTINGSESLTSFKQALYFNQIGFNVHDTMIYQQAGTGAKGSNLAYWQSFEYMFILAKGNPKTVNRLKDIPNSAAGKKRSISDKSNKVGTRQDRANIICPDFSVRANVWYYAVGCNDITDHPAPFPEKLAADHIYSWSNEGDLVYDPFGGSGTTAKMAHLQKRRCIMSEISTEYCQIAKKRIEPYLAQERLF